MRYLHVIKSICITITSIILLWMANSVFADTSKATIYDSSISWEDVVNKSNLLSSVPQYNSADIKLLFDAYIHAKDSLSPEKGRAWQYNVYFIHAFWGPINNPFIKYPRPAKVFIFLNEHTDEFYMAPIFKDTSDSNYYVFDKNAKQPLLLNDWIANLSGTLGLQAALRFNICNGYGDLPTDSCIEKSYQNEAADLQHNNRSIVLASIPNAYRSPQKDWRSYLSKTKTLLGESIYEQSVAWNDISLRNNRLNTISTWPNYTTIQDGFEKIRDLRYFSDESQQDFMRRITWLYPDDGCWTRAAAMVQDFFGPFNNVVNKLVRPSKVFAFGNLCANTPNSPRGKVSWWYHTAPIIRDAETNQSYVLDPSVNPYQPLPVEDWMSRIAANENACAHSDSAVNSFNVCNGYATGPYDSCQNSVRTSYITETSSVLGQATYRRHERYRQTDLGRDANLVLGDMPPWRR